MIQDFQSHIDAASGLSRLNRYRVFIYAAPLKQGSTTIFNAVNAITQFPETDATDWMDYSMSDLPNLDDLRLTAFCDKTSLPNYQFQTDTQRIYGPQFKFPHMPEWNDVTMSFLIGNDMAEKYFFEAWMYMVMDPESNNFNYQREYTCDIDLVTYDETDNANYWTSLIDAWPIAVNEINLSSDDNNSVAKIQVTFTYKFASWFRGSSKAQGIRGAKERFSNTITPNSPNAL